MVSLIKWKIGFEYTFGNRHPVSFSVKFGKINYMEHRTCLEMHMMILFMIESSGCVSKVEK